MDSTYAQTGSSLIHDFSAASASGVTRFCRTRSFLVAWTNVDDTRHAPLKTHAIEDCFVLLPDAGADIVCAGRLVRAHARSVVVLPPGESSVSLAAPGRCIHLFAPIPEKFADAPCVDAAMRIGARCTMQPVLPAFNRAAAHPGVLVYELDNFANSAGMPRAKLFQTSTMSINWVEYSGPRDRTKLSPHSHTDFEQGSLALEGRFVHHFRTPWTADANTWIADEHALCGSDTLAVIPPPIEHTTEGIGEERHILIDIFAPPRRDFIARNQVLNNDAYEDIAHLDE